MPVKLEQSMLVDLRACWQFSSTIKYTESKPDACYCKQVQFYSFYFYITLVHQPIWRLLCISKFPNLKHLEMTLATADRDCYHLCVAFLKASPLFQEFTLKVDVSPFFDLKFEIFVVWIAEQ